MTAIATLRRPVWRGPHSPRHGVTTILRGASWKAGWVIVAHALAGTGDRLMPYPTSGFNSAVTAANGGPLQVPGGDVNGTLRVIAKIPNARFYMPTTGAGSAAAVQVTHGSVTTVIVTIGSATTALTVWQAVRAHAEANEVVDIGLAGTGASLAVAISTTDAPSLTGQALPAVTVPSGRKTGFSAASFSSEVFSRGHSSCKTKPAGVSTGTISP